VTGDDIELLVARNVGVAHCPGSNGCHASGIAPIALMRAAGINVGVATDGPASHDGLDLFEDMRSATHFARIGGKDASCLDAPALLAMVTAEAADAIDRPDLGRLTAGLAQTCSPSTSRRTGSIPSLRRGNSSDGSCGLPAPPPSGRCG